MTLVHILLALVGRHPQSGYELWKWLEVEGRFLRARADRSQIYRTLARLTDDGLVCHTVAESRTGPDAKIHRLTPAGVEALLAWVASPYEPGTSWQARSLQAAPCPPSPGGGRRGSLGPSSRWAPSQASGPTPETPSGRRTVCGSEG